MMVSHAVWKTWLEGLSTEAEGHVFHMAWEIHINMNFSALK